jgi:hypothetical protein
MDVCHGIERKNEGKGCILGAPWERAAPDVLQLRATQEGKTSRPSLKKARKKGRDWRGSNV